LGAVHQASVQLKVEWAMISPHAVVSQAHKGKAMPCRRRRGPAGYGLCCPWRKLENL